MRIPSTLAVLASVAAAAVNAAAVNAAAVNAAAVNAAAAGSSVQEVSEFFSKVLNRQITVTQENLAQVSMEVADKLEDEGFNPGGFENLEDFAKQFEDDDEFDTEEFEEHMEDKAKQLFGSHKSLKKRNAEAEHEYAEAENEYFQCAICVCGQEVVAAAKAQADAEDASGGPLPLEPAPRVLPQRVLPATSPQAPQGGMVITFPSENAVTKAPVTNGPPTGFDPSNLALNDPSTLIEPPRGRGRLEKRRLQKRLLFGVASLIGGMGISFSPEIKKGVAAVNNRFFSKCGKQCPSSQSTLLADVGKENYCSNGRPFLAQ